MIGVQGFAELEYGMLRYMGAIDDSTPVVTTGKCGFFANPHLCSMWCHTYAIEISVSSLEQAA